METDRRSFIKTAALGLQMFANPAEALRTLAAANPDNALLKKFTEYSTELDVENLTNQHLKHLTLGLEDSWLDSGRGIGTHIAAQTRIDSNPDFKAFAGPMTPTARAKLFHHSKAHKKREVELHEKILATLGELKKQPINETAKELWEAGMAGGSIDRAIEEYTSGLKYIKANSFWTDFLQMTAKPSAASVRTFIEKQFWREGGHEQAAKLRKISEKIGVRLNHWDMDEAEEASYRQEQAQEARKQGSRDLEDTALKVRYLEGNIDGAAEGAVEITGNGESLHQLYNSLRILLGDDADKSISIDRKQNRIVVLDPPAEITALVKNAERRTREQSRSR